MGRNKYIDFYRGFAVISIILIHTLFHSGISYVPEKIRNISLLLDVPFFFFISGWCFSNNNIKKTANGFVKIWKIWIVFILLVNFLLRIFGMDGLKTARDWVEAIMFCSFKVNCLPSVGASLWYIPLYFVIALGGTILISILNKCEDYKYFVFSFLLVGIVYLSLDLNESKYIIGGGNIYFGLSKYFLCYMVLFLEGYYTRNLRLKSYPVYWGLCIIIVLGWGAIGYIYGFSIINLQEAKFPPNIMYFWVAHFSIITALFLKGRIDFIVNKCKLISFIGRNSIYYYFAQGIGASVLYVLLPEIHIDIWYIKAMILFFINMVLSIAFGGFLYLIYNKFAVNVICNRFEKCKKMVFEKIFENFE